MPLWQFFAIAALAAFACLAGLFALYAPPRRRHDR
jgi:hypothetical protein